MPKVGAKAPDFELPDADMEIASMAEYLGRALVLFFYVRDDTPGCTTEALEFTDLEEEFKALGCDVIGVSRDDCISHGAFRDKYGLTMHLLADIDGEACEAYRVWREKEAHGEKRMGMVRSTFVVDKEGVIRHALYDVKPKGHAAQVLDLVRAL
jgi:peroxiredoxin